MRAKSAVLLALALGCGLVASIGITQVIAKRNTDPPVPAGDTRTVFVAMVDIPFGDPLTSQVLRLEQWPADKVPNGALSKIEDIQGRRPRTKLYAGEPVLENKLLGKGASQQGATVLIPKGYRVKGVKVDQVSGGGLILPGDRVDVLAHLVRNPVRGIPETTTRTILQDIKVFAVNDIFRLDSSEPDEQKITAKTVQLIVTPAQAEILMLAGALGTIELVMRSPEEEEFVRTPGATVQNLFGLADTADRSKDSRAEEGDPDSGGFLDFLKQAANSAPPAPTQQPVDVATHSMRVIRADQVETVVLEAECDGGASAPGFGMWKVSALDSGSGLGPAEEFPGPDEAAAEEGQEPIEGEEEEAEEEEAEN